MTDTLVRKSGSPSLRGLGTRRLIAALLFLVSLSTPAAASTITWQFAGYTTSTTFVDIPVGSLVTASWTFDSNEPNLCQPTHVTGAYFNQTLTVTAQTTSGPLTWVGTGFLLADTRITTACWTTGHPGEMELRIPTFTGPTLPSGQYPSFGTYPGGLFWVQQPTYGAFPLNQPASVYLQGPFFRSDIAFSEAITGWLTPVPEPSSGVLVLLGCGALLYRRLGFGKLAERRD